MRLLFPNTGRRTYMVEFALDLIETQDLEWVFVSDCDPLAAAMHVSNRVTTLRSPPVLENPSAYADAIYELAIQNGINLIVPVSDLELQPLAEERDRFNAAGICVIISSPQLISTCMDKKKFADFCRAHRLSSPDILTYENPSKLQFPLVRKAILGSGSKGLVIARKADDLAGFNPVTELLQCFVEGDEFGIDILNDLDGRFVKACCKRKLSMRSGETDQAVIVDQPALIELAKQISKSTRHIGNLDCDVIVDYNGASYLIDANPRFGGGYPTTHLAGLDFLKAIVAMARGYAPVLPATPRQIAVSKGISLHVSEYPA